MKQYLAVNNRIRCKQTCSSFSYALAQMCWRLDGLSSAGVVSELPLSIHFACITLFQIRSDVLFWQTSIAATATLLRQNLINRFLIPLLHNCHVSSKAMPRLSCQNPKINPYPITPYTSQLFFLGFYCCSPAMAAYPSLAGFLLMLSILHFLASSFTPKRHH